MSAVTIILTSHMKPTLADAIASVEAQTRQDFELVVMDSGAWVGKDDPVSLQMAAVFEGLLPTDIDLSVHFTGEPHDLRERSCPVSWATNEAIRRGLVRGAYVCTFYDDDLYYPEFVERMAGFLDEHPEEQAVLCAQDRLSLLRDGSTTSNGRIAPAGRLGPGQFDCRVDGAQVMFRRELLDAMGDPWMDESTATCGHSDGLFLERLASLAGSIPAIPDVLLAHRNTPYSTYSPS